MNSGAISHGKAYGLWHYVWKLLRLRVFIFFSGFRRAKTRRKVGTIIVVLLLVGLAAFAFWLSWLLLTFLRSPQVAQFYNPQVLLNSVPAIVITVAFLVIFTTSFGVLLQALYLARDMDFLLTSPMPMRAVFITKLMQAILPNFGLICLFSLPVLFGLGVSGGYNFLYYPLVVLTLALLTLAAGGLSSLLVMAVVRMFPARRVAEVLGFAGGIIGIIVSQSGNLMSHVNVSDSQVTSSLNRLVQVDTLWSPLAWVGRAVVAVGEGRWVEGLLLTVLSLSLASVVFWTALTAAERLYYSGWASLQGQALKKKAAKAAASPLRKEKRPGLERFIPAQVRALMVKDLVLIRRDLRNLSAFITPLVFGVVLLFTMLRGGANGFEGDSLVFAQAGKNARVYLGLAIMLFVGWSTLLNLAMGAFSREGRSYWLIKTSPVNANSLLIAKYLVVYFPSLVVLWILVVISALFNRSGLAMLVYSLGVTALAIAGLAGLNLAFGVTGAKLDWQDPRQMNNATTGCLGSFTSFIYLGVVLAFFFGPPVLFYALGFGETLGMWVGLAAGAILSLACALFPLLLVRKRVDKIGLA
jgi:ABC-2 type transport system permease protein